MGTAGVFIFKYIKMGNSGLGTQDDILFAVDKQKMISKYFKHKLQRLGL